MSNCCRPICRIGPSILNSDLANLASECDRMLKAGADYLHLDVMDGHFVPNITFGAPVVKCLRSKITKSFFDIHMMVSEPIKWIEDMADAGADQYTFHVESECSPPDVIRKVKEAGMKVGLAIKPNTSLDCIISYIDEVDMVLIMTVEPGFGGQKFMENMMSKVEHVREQFPVLDIGVDGGVGTDNIDIVARAGANMIVSGTAVVKSPHPDKTILTLRSGVEKWLYIQ